MQALPPGSVDCIWTDPPYLLSNDGITCVAGKMVKVNKGEWDRSRGVDLDHEFNRTWLAACHRVLKPSGAIWVSGTLHAYLSVGIGHGTRPLAGFVIVLAYSRAICALFTLDQTLESFLRGHVDAFQRIHTPSENVPGTDTG
jgi:hypothetical protein